MTMDPSLQGSRSSSPPLCALCAYKEPDVVTVPCNCYFHARCIPVQSLCTKDGIGSTEPRPIASGAAPCPGCQISTVVKFTILPLSTTYLDEALAKRKQIIVKGMTDAVGWQNEIGTTSPEIQAENHYLLVLRGHSSSVTGGDTSHQRTGRWTKEEVALTDFLIKMFDDGRLPIEQGVKLSDFLADFLLCKSSRLSKKMKNSQLGTRSYNLRFPAAPMDVGTLSMLLDRFLQAIPSEPTRYELQFNITKFWRTRLSNLALELHSNLMDVTQWIAGLEVIEEKAAAAQERIRTARRKRLGLDCNGSMNNTSELYMSSSSSLPVLPIESTLTLPTDFTGGLDRTFSDTDLGAPTFSFQNGMNPFPSFAAAAATATDGQSNASSKTSAKRRKTHNHSDEAAAAAAAFALDDDALSLSQSSGVQTSTRYVRTHCGPFLSQIMHYIEQNDLPFQHADVWVPSFSNDASTNDGLKLFHAGYVTRNDMDWVNSSNMDHFGEESSKITFAPGSGIPGRVFWSGKPEWQRHLDRTTPDIFLRVAQANQYGIQTCFCFPLATSVIGKICVAMYSNSDLEEDQELIERCMMDLGRLSPTPKWKLVVEMSGEPLDLPDRVARPTQTSNDDGPVERRIATLLGDHMPLSDITSDRSAPTEAERKREALLPHFLALRLLILRPVNRRSAQEKERIKLIVDSFRGYDTGRRSDEDLAFLIVRDWVYISGNS